MSQLAICLIISVLPTPVEPTNKMFCFKFHLW